MNLIEIISRKYAWVYVLIRQKLFENCEELVRLSHVFIHIMLLINFTFITYLFDAKQCVGFIDYFPSWDTFNSLFVSKDNQMHGCILKHLGGSNESHFF